jgi:hypothetical protein
MCDTRCTPAGIESDKKASNEMETCTHDTSIVLQDFKGFSILRCTWACGLELIELKGRMRRTTIYVRACIENTRGIVGTISLTTVVALK